MIQGFSLFLIFFFFSLFCFTVSHYLKFLFLVPILKPSKIETLTHLFDRRQLFEGCPTSICSCINLSTPTKTKLPFVLSPSVHAIFMLSSWFLEELKILSVKCIYCILFFCKRKILYEGEINGEITVLFKCWFLYFFFFFLTFRLRIAVLPILLHLHQGQLDFLVSFFGGKNQSVDQSPSHCHASDGTKLSSTKNSNFARHAISEEALLPYFQASVLNHFSYHMLYFAANFEFSVLVYVRTTL